MQRNWESCSHFINHSSYLSKKEKKAKLFHQLRCDDSPLMTFFFVCLFLCPSLQFIRKTKQWVMRQILVSRRLHSVVTVTCLQTNTAEVKQDSRPCINQPALRKQTRLQTAWQNTHATGPRRRLRLDAQGLLGSGSFWSRCWISCMKMWRWNEDSESWSTRVHRVRLSALEEREGLETVKHKLVQIPEICSEPQSTAMSQWEEVLIRRLRGANPGGGTDPKPPVKEEEENTGELGRAAFT